MGGAPAGMGGALAGMGGAPAPATRPFCPARPLTTLLITSEVAA
jgi:hypothetical protein